MGVSRQQHAMTHESFTLRPATPADHPRLASLDARLVGEATCPGATPADFIRFQAGFTAAALAEPRGHTVLAVDPADALLGYIHLVPQTDDVLGHEVGYVSIVAVAEAAAGKGIGRALMAAAEDWAKALGYPALLLDVFASNRSARAFYDALGYAEDSLRLRKVL